MLGDLWAPWIDVVIVLAIAAVGTPLGVWICRRDRRRNTTR